jgi:hypothetical protein
VKKFVRSLRPASPDAVVRFKTECRCRSIGPPLRWTLTEVVSQLQKGLGVLSSMPDRAARGEPAMNHYHPDAL